MEVVDLVMWLAVSDSIHCTEPYPLFYIIEIETVLLSNKNKNENVKFYLEFFTLIVVEVIPKTINSIKY